MSQAETNKQLRQARILSDLQEDNKNLLYLTFIGALNKKRPLFSYQKEVLDHLLSKDPLKRKRYVMLNCGRKWTKTFICCYFLWRKALETPNSVWYYVLPTAEQGYEIVWDRLQNFGPKSVEIGGKKHPIVTDIKTAKLEIRFFNGAKIKIVGSTGTGKNALRGGEPHGCVYDEYKDHSPAFHIAMEPNFLVYSAQLLIIGTPPYQQEIDSGEKRFYQDMMDFCGTSKRGVLITRPSLDNPIPEIRENLLAKKEELFAMGKRGIAIWESEYEGKIVHSGKDDFIPQFKHSDLVEPHKLELCLVDKPSGYRYAVVMDAGGGTRWGALLLAVEEATKKVFVLDKYTIASADLAQVHKMSHDQFFAEVVKRVEFMSPPGIATSDWRFFYDSADAEFSRNITNNPNNVAKHKLWPVNKRKFGKMEGYSQIKDLKLAGRLILSERVAELVDEFCAIELDAQGIPKKRFNELIDCLRYFMFEFDHFLKPRPEHAEALPDSKIERYLYLLQKRRQERVDPFEGLLYTEDMVDDECF